MAKLNESWMHSGRAIFCLCVNFILTRLVGIWCFVRIELSEGIATTVQKQYNDGKNQVELVVVQQLRSPSRRSETSHKTLSHLHFERATDLWLVHLQETPFQTSHQDPMFRIPEASGVEIWVEHCDLHTLSLVDLDDRTLKQYQWRLVSFVQAFLPQS